MTLTSLESEIIFIVSLEESKISPWNNLTTPSQNQRLEQQLNMQRNERKTSK